MTIEALPKEHQLQNGKYVIKELRGQGGFGITYVANFTTLGTTVAIKECFLEKFCRRAGSDVAVNSLKYTTLYEKYRSEFLNEARKIAECNHPNVVKIQDYFEENNTAYYVMEYIPGVTLQELIKQKGKLPAALAIKFIKQISEALQLVHNKSIIHRDVKPSNIMITENNVAILIDFGAARDIINIDEEHTVILTSGFAPPEQYEKDGAKGFFVDIYAIGATLYFALTNEIPPSGRKRMEAELTPLTSFRRDISIELNDFVIKALNPDPHQRYSSISDLIYNLTTIPQFDSHSHYEPTKSQSDAINIFDAFLHDYETNCLIILGPVYSGKSTLISSFINMILKESLHFRALAVGSRLAERIRNKNHIASISSLYSLIYDFEPNLNGKEESENIAMSTDKTHFSLRKNTEPRNCIYIVDDAQLLSDFTLESEFLTFGSGKLLNDFIHYIDFESSARKLVVLGDATQLQRGSEQESALSKSHLEFTYNLNVKQFELADIISYTNNAILEIALAINETIRSNQFNNLQFLTDNQTVFTVQWSEFEDHYLGLTEQSETIYINYSNKQVRETNWKIREFLQHKGPITAGDRIITYSHLEVKDINQEYLIYAGEFGIVLSSDSSPETIVLDSKTKKSYNVWRVKIRFPRLAVTLDIRVLEDFLLSESVKLSTEEIRILKKFSKREGGYLDKNLNSEGIPVLLVKYGYAITCHKAQGHNWKNVYIDFETDQGKANKSYFSWCYTALTRAENKAFLINPPKISPYILMNWKANNTALDSSLSFSPHLKNIELTPELMAEMQKHAFPTDKLFLTEFFRVVYHKLLPHNITILKISHNLFQEIYEFSDVSGQKGKIIFHYNGQEKFTKKIAQPVSTFTTMVVTILDTPMEAMETYECNPPDNFQFNFLHDFFFDFQKQLRGIGVLIYACISSSFQEKYILFKDGCFVQYSFHYNSDGFFTTVYPEKTNCTELLSLTESLIIEKYIQNERA